MSTYVKISKEIGWDPQEVEIPTLYNANFLVAKANKGDIKAFTQLFKIYRFAPSPSNDEETEAMEIVINGFLKVKHIFT